MIQSRRAIGLLVATLLVLAACGDDGGSASPGGDTGGGQGTPTENLIRIAYNLDQFDLEIGPVHAYGSQTHFGMAYHVFGAPLQVELDGTYSPFLAESFEVVDNFTIDLTLREGLTFHDGLPYDAQTLADTMLDYQQMDTEAFGAYPLDQLESIDVNGDTEMTFHLSEPVAIWFLDALANAPAVIGSPDHTRATPAGAGPYRVVEFVEDDRLVVEKFDEFFAADDYEIERIEWLHLQAVEARQNALVGGQVDVIVSPPGDLDALLQRGPYEVVITNAQTNIMLAPCKASPPFDDPTFREAFELALDRDEIDQIVWAGYSETMAGVWNPGATYAVPGLYSDSADVDAARALLDEIGWDSSATMPIGYYPGNTAQELLAETMAGMMARVGINLVLTPMESFLYSDYVNPDVGGLTVVGAIFAGPVALATPGAEQASHWNPCGDDHSELQELIDPLLAGGLSDDAMVDAWREAQENLRENNLWYPLTTQPFVYVYNSDRVAGLEEGAVSMSAGSVPQSRLAGVSIIGS